MDQKNAQNPAEVAKETGAEETGTKETIDEPVMDGATETYRGDEDPRKGEADPALVRHPERHDKNTAPYNL